MLGLANDIWYGSRSVSGGLAIRYYVREDGTASTYADATDPATPAGAMDLAQLLLDLEAGNIPNGSVIGFSSNSATASDYDSFADKAVLTDFPAQIYLYDTIIYTNVPGDDIVFDKTGLTGGTGGTIGVRNLVADGLNQTLNTGRLEVQSTGSITFQGKNNIEVIEGVGSAGSANYGVKIIGVTYADNENDIVSLGNQTTMEVRNIDGVGPSVGGNSQVFTTHGTSKLRVTGFNVSGMQVLSTAVIGTEIELNDGTATDVINVFHTNDAGTVVWNDVHVTLGSSPGAIGRLFTSNGVGSFTMNRGSVTSGVGAEGSDPTVSAGSQIFNEVVWNWLGTKGRTTVSGSPVIEHNDCTYNITSLPTRLYQISSAVATPRMTWNRPRFNTPSKIEANSDWIRMTADATFANGSGVFSGIISGGFKAFLEVTVAHPSSVNFDFEQVTAVGTSILAPLARFVDENGDVGFYNCHFSDIQDVVAHVGTEANFASTADECSYFNSGWNGDPAKNTNSTAVIDEDFTNKGSDPADLHIAVTSDLYRSGGVARITSLTDYDGIDFDSPNASTGAYEVPNGLPVPLLWEDGSAMNWEDGTPINWG